MKYRRLLKRARMSKAQRVEMTSKECRGFTLVELSAVLFLIVLMVGLGTFFVANRLPSASVDATAREMLAVARRARSFAVMNGTDQRVIVDLDSRRFSLAGMGSRQIPPEVGIKVVDPLRGEIRSGKYEILFSADGLSQGGDLVLWSSKKTAVVRTDPVAGAVRIER